MTGKGDGKPYIGKIIGYNKDCRFKSIKVQWIQDEK